MPNFCKVIILGHAGRDAETVQTNTGTPMTKLSVAHNPWRRNDEKATIWFDVVFFGKTAERAAAITKGTAIYIEGPLDQETWQDKNSGADRTKLVIKADNFQFLGGGGNPNGGQGGGQKTSPVSAGDGDETPF
jgi:single-strand DNA-binding protein